MTQQPSDTLTPYAPLPVRARGTLEIFDTAFKLFRRYAGVLLAWSALSSLINLVPLLGILSYIFTMPLMFGAVSCVVAGAVRGQNVGFKQIWGFTKPRYGALLGVLIIAMILMGIVMFVLMVGGSLLVILFANIASGYGWFVSGVAWILGTLVGLIGSSFLLAVLLGWFNLAPIIACLEDANRGTNALSRAWSLMSGNWRKACGVATILALAGTAAWAIIFGFVMFFFYGGWDKFIGADTSFASGLAVSGFATLFFVAWTPLQAVVGAVFYLDLRTRKEALDLEWTNYAAKPETLPTQGAHPPAFSPAPPPAPMGNAPMGGPPYAPASSLQAAPAPPNTNIGGAPQVPVFAAQSPAQGQPQTREAISSTPAPAPTTPPGSFADFASQIAATPQNMAPPPPINIEAAPVPVEAQIVAPAPLVSPPSPLPAVVQPEPMFPAPVNPLEVAPTTPDVGSTGNSASPAPPITTEPAPVPVASEPAVAPAPPPPPVVPPAPAAAEPRPEPAQTSSFAPPPRFRRATSEDDDYPSSFGGGA